jgi:hypothetical protein
VNTSKKESGSAHLIIIVILAIAVIGLLGYVFWQNVSKKASNTKSDATSLTTSTTKQAKSDTSQPVISTTQSFAGGFGFSGVAFNYPKDWTVDADTDLGGTGGGVGPGILIKSPEYKVVNDEQGQGIDGDYIDISTTTAWSSVSNWQSTQQADDPSSTFGDFTFSGDQAVIWNANGNGTPTLADMYKGSATWIQHGSTIYTFNTSYNSGASNAQELDSAINTVLSSWKWQ